MCILVVLEMDLGALRLIAAFTQKRGTHTRTNFNEQRFTKINSLLLFLLLLLAFFLFHIKTRRILINRKLLKLIFSIYFLYMLYIHICVYFHFGFLIFKHCAICSDL